MHNEQHNHKKEEDMERANKAHILKRSFTNKKRMSAGQAQECVRMRLCVRGEERFSLVTFQPMSAKRSSQISTGAGYLNNIVFLQVHNQLSPDGLAVIKQPLFRHSSEMLHNER